MKATIIIRFTMLITCLCVGLLTGHVEGAQTCKQKCDASGGVCLKACPAAEGAYCPCRCAERHTHCSKSCAAGTGWSWNTTEPTKCTLPKRDLVVIEFGRYDSTGTLLLGQGETMAAEFSFIEISQIDLDSTDILDTILFEPLGAGTFNPETSVWEYQLNTADLPDGSYYIFRAAFFPHSDSATNDYGYALASTLPASVPTLAEWGRIILVVLLLGSGAMAWHINRRRRASEPGV